MRDKQPPATNLPSIEDTNQTRTLGMPLAKSDFDNLDQPNPFVGMGHNPATSAKQARFMQGCLHNPGAMEGKCPSKKVAKEFSHEGG
jgi:hypothetical protein